MTRATLHLLDGDVTEALRHNVLLLPFALWLAASATHRVGPPSARARAALVIALVAFTLVRNLPGPDAWLSPPQS